MIRNLTKAKLAAGERVVGCFLRHAASDLAEYLALLGWDYLVFDGEHGAVTSRDISNLSRAVELHGVTPIARVPTNLPHPILRFLDAGAHGVHVPWVNTPSDADRAVRSVKYHPRGVRGLAGNRSGEYALNIPLEEAVQVANRETLTVIHIESFSKVYSIPGYRVGAMAASPDLLHEADKVADCLTICPSRIGQEAALYGLGHLAGWVEANRSTMNRRVRQFGDVMRDSSYEVVSAGAYFAYVRHPFEGVPGVRVARRLFEEHAVLCLAGEMFGPDQDRYLRLAFANLEDRDIPELARRLDESASGV